MQFVPRAFINTASFFPPTLNSTPLSYRLDRFEMKFVITREQREALEKDTTPRMKPDENAVDGAFYPIVSLYYDTPDRVCYWEKEEGYQNRRKMRTRCAPSTSLRPSVPCP